MKVTHGIPCIDPCIQRRMRGRNHRLISLAWQSPHGDNKQAEMTNYNMKCDRSIALRWALHDELYHLTISRQQ